MTTLMLFPVLLLVLAVAGIVATARHRIRSHGLLVLLWRWHSGDTWHGQPVTDAGWVRPGVKALTPTGHAPRFHHRPRWQRALWRSVPTLTVLLALWGLLFYPTATLAVLAAATVAGLASGTWRTARWWQLKKHRRTWVEPVHLVAAPQVGIAVAADSSWLQIAPDRSHVRAQLPPAYNPDAKQRERLVGTLTSKLGIESPDVHWHMAGPSPVLELTQSQPPPAKVTLADVRDALGAARPDELVWGLGKRAATSKTSLSGDSPHVGLSMGSGAGKSETAKSLLAQQLHRGAIGLVLDHKMMSHLWARGLPNVVLAIRVPEIHQALCWLGREVDRRKEVAYHGADMDGNVRATVGPRIIVVLEELNATVAQLRAYWRETRAKDDAVRSPALDALDAVSFMGRSVLVNLIYIGQRLSDKATGGGGDARENIGVIAFARYRPSTWKMLAPDFPVPPKNNAPGRLQVVSDQVQETQGILMTTAEARELALSGTVSPLPAGMPGAPRATAETVSRPMLKTSPDLASATVSGPVPVLPVSGGVTLSEAVKAGVFGGLTLAGVRTARHRDEGFPEPVGRHGLAHLYDPEALAVWADGRNGT